MLKATLRSLISHKLRLLMTALSIVLGVSFVAGTYVLSDTLNSTFDNLFQNVYSGVDVTVRGAQTFEVSAGQEQPDERPPLPEELLEQVRGVDGVNEAEGSVSGIAAFVDKGGEAIIPTGPPTLGVSWGNVDDLNPLTLRSGSAPDGDDEVAMDARTAEANGFVVGDTVKVITKGPQREFTLSGVVGFGALDNLAGATLAVFDVDTAQELFDKEGLLDTVDVTSEPGVSPRELQDRIADAIGNEYDVATGNQVTAENSEQLKEGLSFFSTALLAFAFIALFVGSFIIANTFSIIVAQRTRELALLRAIGASRRQVMTSIVAEAVITGLFASIVGIGFGILVALGLQKLLTAFGLELPSGPLVISAKTYLIPPLIGIGVTVMASIAPARRATKVPPVAAMREDYVVPSSAGKKRIVGGLVILVVGVALLFFGLFRGGDDAVQSVGLGALLVFGGVAAVAPVLAVPLARGIGAPFARWFNVPGRIARDNSMRNPKRTASTAAALMIGVALVGFVTVFASSIKASTSELIDGSTNFDLIVQSKSFTGFSPEVAATVGGLDGVETAVGFRAGQARIDGKTVSVEAAELTAAGDVLTFDMISGEVADAASSGVLVSEQEADTNGWTLGDTITMEFQSSPAGDFEIKGIYERNPLAGNYVMGLSQFEDAFVTQQDFVVLILGTEGTSPESLRSTVDSELEAFPNVEVQNKTEYLRSQEEQIDQLLGLVSALLGLALIIAFIGIVNTLALSIFERTREIGMLRAIGMARVQVKRMIRWESVIVAVLGAVLGLAIGIFFGWAMVIALSDQGITALEIPFGSLLFYVVIAGLAGVLAAVLPARRAAKIDVLRAISTE